ncbi:hypothetical protein BGZ49_001570 [Haplosporangium sp. Z 27]|nr:hypothetical protein BGZ49_001570 [Haplosporangium sp. Z 27]
MKISTVSTMLCLAAVAAAANIERTTYEHPYVSSSSLERRDASKAVNRHEKRGGDHDEHHVEAHNDGPRKKHKGGKEKNHEKDEVQSKDKDEKKENNNEDNEASEEKSKDDDKSRNGGDKKKGDDQSSDKEDAKDADNDAKGNAKDDGNKNVADKDEGAPAGKAPAGNAPAGSAPAGNSPAGKSPAGNSPAGNNGASNTLPRDYASALWLVQPFAASVWEQGRAYVITWGPNPEPSYAKKLKAKSPVDIRLMRGPPESLHEVAVLKNGVDESLHSFQWTVPTSATPAKDYTIRISHGNDVDTYSHYFEIVKAGDPRSSKSNVGEPIVMPQKGDAPKPLDKGGIIKPAAPPNPFPSQKSNTSNGAGQSKPSASSTPGTPAAAKPAVHTSGARDTQSANILAFVMTLLAAVYFL